MVVVVGLLGEDVTRKISDGESPISEEINIGPSIIHIFELVNKSP